MIGHPRATEHGVTNALRPLGLQETTPSGWPQQPLRNHPITTSSAFLWEALQQGP